MSDRYEYGNVVWHLEFSTKQTADLERIQRRAWGILGQQFKLYRNAVGRGNMEYLRRETHCKREMLRVWVTIYHFPFKISVSW